MNRVVRRLKRRYNFAQFLERNGASPFRILIGCILSLRTKDEVSFPATARLFAKAATPRDMLRLRAATIARLIYPVGFYNRKADQIRGICRELINRNDSDVPDSIDELLTLPGVGRKTANLVVTLGFGKPGICVDTHVHRISNRLGWVVTPNPDATEQALRRALPRRHWIAFNELLVHHGQNICKPISPLCSECMVSTDCRRVGVDRSR
jgi:endonuclease-3